MIIRLHSREEMEQYELAGMLVTVLFELEIDITIEQLLDAADATGIVFTESPN